MIKNFRNRASLEIAQGIDSSESRRLLPINLHKVARIKLAALNRAKNLSDLFVPGWRLEKLRGDRSGQHNIRINKQFRVCFVWVKEGPFDVEIVDYH